MPNRLQKTTSLDYRLPSTVEYIQHGWLISCQGSAVISGLLAVAAALLLILFKNPQTFEGTRENSAESLIALEILGYASLFLNISACISCFILLDRLGDVPYHAAQDPNPPIAGKATLPQVGILRIYGIGALWRWVVWHWLICFLSGAWSIFAQVLLYIWLQGSKESKIVMTCLSAFCVLPCTAFLLAPFVNALASKSVRRAESTILPNFETQSPTPPRRIDIESSPHTPITPHTPHSPVSTMRSVHSSSQRFSSFSKPSP